MSSAAYLFHFMLDSLTVMESESFDADVWKFGCKCPRECCLKIDHEGGDSRFAGQDLQQTS